jgi:lipopolysaccharide/colanic/teichoic acid biosynthesis glycosyltransferase
MKRALDIVLSATLLILLSPVIAAVALAIRVAMGPPVLFRQVRPGQGERPFALLKFRTMTGARSPSGELLGDGLRLTHLGSFLRRSSLDELPTLLNVLKGELSLVGPRPLLMRYLPYFTARERLRFAVPPGITGWAQVNGRNNTPWNVRLEQDAWYVENRSLLLDLEILVRTLLRVAGGRDVVVDARSVMLNLDEERAGAGQSAREGG